MFVLIDKGSGGVYAVKDEDNLERVVQMFVDKDDADRYYGLLVANDYDRELEVMEVDEETVKFNCRGHGYRFSVITPDDIVIPPV